MRPKRCHVENFGSYAESDIDFSNLGLTLISGPTGSGKSTITDFISFACFGITSKNGAADDVRAWGCDQPTKVILEVDLPDGTIEITRTRGKASQNDLFWTEAANPDKQVRGKDATETQKLLSKRLGVDADLYLLASAFTQFSDTDRFFTCKPAQRREVLERITDLSLAVTLGERASEERKVAKKELEALEASLAKETGRLEQIKAQIAQTEKLSATWEVKQAQQIEEAEQKAAKFAECKAADVACKASQLEMIADQIQDDAPLAAAVTRIRCDIEKLTGIKAKYQKALQKVSEIRAELSSAQRDLAKQEKLPDTCPECNRPGANPNKEEHLKKHQTNIAHLNAHLSTAEDELSVLAKTLEAEPLLNRDLLAARQAVSDNDRLKERLAAAEQALLAADAAVNPYGDRLDQLKKATNPYIQPHHDLGLQAVASRSIVSRTEELVAQKTHRVASLTSIYDISFALRGELLQNAVTQLERETNSRLAEYFESPFRVRFLLQDSDKLEVEIHRDEFTCRYTQLSGGQRRMMTIAFSTALMQLAADTAGVSFGLMAFDEVLQGLDSELKLKAFRLFERLSQDVGSVLLVEHDEGFKGLFENVWNVSIDESGVSTIEMGETANMECQAILG